MWDNVASRVLLDHYVLVGYYSWCVTNETVLLAGYWVRQRCGDYREKGCMQQSQSSANRDTFNWKKCWLLACLPERSERGEILSDVVCFPFPPCWDSHWHRGTSAIKPWQWDDSVPGVLINWLRKAVHTSSITQYVCNTPVQPCWL